MDLCIEQLTTPGRGLKSQRRLFDFTAFLRAMIAVILRGWLKVFHRLTIDGLGSLPTKGSFILVANHASHLDTLCLQSIFPIRKLHRVFPAACAKYFLHVRHRWAAAVIVTNALLLHSEMHFRESLATFRSLLANEGNVLILYPEGTRSTDGRMGPFRPGIGALLGGTSLPVVPCYLEGAGSALAKGRWFPRPWRIRVTIGQPRSYPLLRSDRMSHQLIAHDLEQAVHELSYSMKGASQVEVANASLSPSAALFAGRKV